MGNALVNAMAFFVWSRTRAPRSLARLNTGRARPTSSQSTTYSVCVSALNKTQAEDLLDWLEATGHQRRKLTYTEGEGFSVFYS
jgi:hypothetical protein